MSWSDCNPKKKKAISARKLKVLLISHFGVAEFTSLNKREELHDKLAEVQGTLVSFEMFQQSLSKFSRQEKNEIELKRAEIQEKLQEIENLKQRNDQLQLTVNNLEEQLEPFLTYLTENNRIDLFSDAKLAIQDKAGWTIEQLRERLAQFQSLLLAHQANKIKLESKIQQLTDQLTLANQKEQQWEQQKASAKEILALRNQLEQEIITIFNQTALENVQLKSKIKYVENLEKSLNKKEQEIEILKEKVENLERLLELRIDTWEVEKMSNSWSYELSWLGIGILLVVGIKKVADKLRRKNPGNKNLVKKEKEDLEQIINK